MKISEIYAKSGIKVKSLSPETGKKRGRKPKIVSVDEIRNFVLSNGAKMTNEKMSKVLKVDLMRIAGCVAALKRTKAIGNDFLLSDLLPKVIVVKTEKRGRKPAHISEDESRTGKAVSREIMIAEIKHSGINSGKIASLPASKCLIERRIVSEVSPLFSFDLIEKDEETFRKMSLTAIKEKLNVSSMNKCFVSEVLAKAKENEFSHLVLDYCGTFERIYEEISDAMKRDIVKVGGTIAITFCQRYKKSNIIESLNLISAGTERTKTENALQSFVNKFAGYKLKRMYSYRDGMTMMLVIIQRIK